MKLRDLVPWKGDETRVPVRGGEPNPLARLQREMNSLFDDFFSSFRSPLALFGQAPDEFRPRINVEETAGEIRVRAELPGMDEKDLNISLTGDALTLQGERRHEEEREEGATYYSESSYGSFQRVIPLGTEIDPDRVEARMKNGVLTIKLPKTEEERRNVRRISVKSE